MAKILRALQKIFSATGETVQFGSLRAGSAVFTKDAEAIQAIPAFEGGWQSAVFARNTGTIQDQNALDYLFSRQIAYILQAGVAEWDDATEYHYGDLARHGSGVVFRSVQNDNTNNALTDPAWWEPAIPTSGEQTSTYGITCQLTGTGDEDLAIVLTDRYGNSLSPISPALQSLATQASSTGIRAAISKTIMATAGTSLNQLIIPASSNLGRTNAVKDDLYVYAYESSGAIALACSYTYFDPTVAVNTVAMTTSLTTRGSLYAYAADTGIFPKLIGCIQSTQTGSVWTVTGLTVTIDPTRLAIINREAATISVAKIVDTRASTMGWASQYLNSVKTATPITKDLAIPDVPGKYIVTVSFMFVYTNSNGTGMNTGVMVYLKNGATTLATAGPATVTVPSGYANPIMRVYTFLIDVAAGFTLTVDAHENNVGGGSYTAANGHLTISAVLMRDGI